MSINSTSSIGSSDALNTPIRVSSLGQGPKPDAQQAPQQQAQEPVLAGAEHRAKVDEGQLDKLLGNVNQAVKAADEHLQFSVHKGSNDIVVKLVDNSTGEVLREIPSEKFLDMVTMLQKIAGMNVDTKA
jgi:uncharacterized FlaG/YvyC family protein